ncbi:MAG TPA: hypothetical protein VNF92_09240 [Gemmatimonadaceae bacterium]|nr:hypothetical protein [Gemmatimonadaceae bacterium]
MRRMLAPAAALIAGVNFGGADQPAKTPAPSCAATSTSLTPAAWAPAPRAAAPIPRRALTVVEDIPIPGPANRFDYQSYDPATHRIYINHMDAGVTLVFDTDNGRVVAQIGDLPRATGVLAVPAHHAVYVSAAGSHEVAIIDDRTLKVTARVGGAFAFPTAPLLLRRPTRCSSPTSRVPPTSSSTREPRPNARRLRWVVKRAMRTTIRCRTASS